MQTSMMPFGFCSPFHTPLRSPPNSPGSSATHPYVDFPFPTQALNRTVLASQNQHFSRKSTGVSSFTIEAILGLQQQRHQENPCSVFTSPVSIGCWPASASPSAVDCRRTPPSPGSLSPDSTKKERVPAPSPSVQTVRSDEPSKCSKGSSAPGRTLCSPNSLHVVGGNSKAKRVRTIFTPEQLERLEREFERQQYMVGPERLYLASSLHLSEAQVKVWFQNRRIKWRKQHLEVQQARLARLRQQGATPPNMDDLSASSADEVMHFSSD